MISTWTSCSCIGEKLFTIGINKLDKSASIRYTKSMQSTPSSFRGRGTRDLSRLINMSEANIQQHMQQLTEELRYHDKLYYQESRQEIPDAEYDALFEELRQLEEKYPKLAVDGSPIKTVNDGLSSTREKVQHHVPMLSLDKAHEEDRLHHWLQTVDGHTLSVAPKFDGVSMSLQYEDGKLVRGVTRGNGTVGDDITENVRIAQQVPSTLPVPFTGEVRGEVVMHKSDMEAFNAAYPDEELSNVRNGCSGALGRKHPDPRRVLHFYAFDLQEDGMQSQHQASQRMEELGFVSPFHTLAQNSDDVLNHIDMLAQKRPTLPYEIDGVVVKVDDYDARAAMGSTSRAPRWAIAWKYAPEQVTTYVKDVRWQVGRGGSLTPVAELETVTVGGVEVSNATLHNPERLEESGLTIGAEVVVERAGDVIPQVAEVTGKHKGQAVKIVPPTNCPSCGAATVKVDKRIACPNYNCGAQVRERLRYWASRDAMDMDSVGPAVIDQLVEAGKVTQPADLYSLTPEDFLELDRMGQRSAERAVRSIQGSKDRDMRQVGIGLGIPMASQGTWKRLQRVYPDLEAVANASREDLEKIDDIGPAVAENLYTWLRKPEIVQIRQQLAAAGVQAKAPVTAAPAADSPWAGKTVVITGTLSRGRKEIADALEAAGAKVSSSVGKNTDFLLAGENAGSKRSKAESLGTNILSETDIQDLFS